MKNNQTYVQSSAHSARTVLSSQNPKLAFSLKDTGVKIVPIFFTLVNHPWENCNTISQLLFLTTLVSLINVHVRLLIFDFFIMYGLIMDCTFIIFLRIGTYIGMSYFYTFTTANICRIQKKFILTNLLETFFKTGIGVFDGLILTR